MDNDLLTIAQTAAFLQVSDKTIRRLIKSSELTASKVGSKSWRISKNDLNCYLKKNTNEKDTENE